jgi:heme/copper-type cytochrome/quinol oxidase subunit 1
MTPQEDVKLKARIYAFAGIGIAGLIGAYQFATQTPAEGTPSTAMPVIFVIVALVCFVIAGMTALKLRKES